MMSLKSVTSFLKINMFKYVYLSTKKKKTLDTSQTCRLAKEDAPRRLLLQSAVSLQNNI